MTYSKSKVLTLSPKPQTHSAGAKAIEITKAAKITNCSATYLSQVTCPKTCSFLNNGCYAESGPVSWQRPDKERVENPYTATSDECRHINNLSGTRPLRLHVVGDAYDSVCARSLAAASKAYSERHSMPVWTYTHNWREIPREEWGDISVLASCETPVDIQEAQERGYATAIVAPNPPTEAKATKLPDGSRLLACLHETLDIPCIKCGVCMNDKRLLEKRITIVFSAHGAQKKKVQLALEHKAH
tara:strand:+ start:2783 stop:3514 length:732 start_codon:yes stop_codon:yes gene_type:complete